MIIIMMVKTILRMNKSCQAPLANKVFSLCQLATPPWPHPQHQKLFPHTRLPHSNASSPSCPNILPQKNILLIPLFQWQYHEIHRFLNRACVSTVLKLAVLLDSDIEFMGHVSRVPATVLVRGIRVEMIRS